MTGLTRSAATVGDENLDVKPGEHELIGKRGTQQLVVQELELEQPQDPDKGTQEASPDLEGETREAAPDPEEGTQEALPDPEEEIQEAPLNPGQKVREMPLDRKEETREAPSDSDEETREAPSDPDEETREAPSNVAGLAAGSTDLEGLVVPARWKLTISGNLPPNNVIAHAWSRRVHAGVKGAAPQSFLPMNEEGDEKSVLMYNGGGAMILQREVEIPESIARGMSPEQ